jgi:hypothetical protein
MWKNIVKPVWPQTTLWRMRIASWIAESTNTHSECVIIIALQLQQWLQERASKLRSTHIVACLVASGQQRLHHTEDCLATTAECQQVSSFF